jgi:hypothetical protein
MMDNRLFAACVAIAVLSSTAGASAQDCFLFLLASLVRTRTLLRAAAVRSAKRPPFTISRNGRTGILPKR